MLDMIYQKIEIEVNSSHFNSIVSNHISLTRNWGVYNGVFAMAVSTRRFKFL